MTMTADVIRWGESRGILPEFGKGDTRAQFLKVVEEVGELSSALARLPSDKELPLHDVEDAIGDIQVTLIMTAATLGIDYDRCLYNVYRVIAQRNGKMVDGVFVKSED